MSVLEKISISLEPLAEEALAVFMERLIEIEGDNLLRVVLYGSAARGDYGRESDIDLFILVREGHMLDLMSRISSIAVETDIFVSRGQTLISPLIVTLDEWEHGNRGLTQKLPIYQNVIREGVVLYDTDA